MAIFGMIVAMSTSSQTIAGSFPPSSRVTRYKVLEQLSITLLPVAIEPVKLTISIPACSVSWGPRSSPPLKTWKTPGGKIAIPSSPSLRSQYGVKGDGFMINVFPAIRQGPIFPTPSNTGQFQGTMPQHTPIGGNV